MARLAAQENLNFFPLPLPIIEMIAREYDHIHEEAVICDPCAGEGEAVEALANALEIDQSRIVASELHSNRSQALKERLPKAMVSTETDALSCDFLRARASVLYLNPPYDGEMGHTSGRSELTFLIRATSMLRAGGQLIYVVPRKFIKNSGTAKKYLHNWYQNIGSFDFPASVRKFDECVIIGEKRRQTRNDQFPPWGMLTRPDMQACSRKIRRGEIFELRKTAYNDGELLELMDFTDAVESIQGRYGSGREQFRPPMTLGEGHIALLLAAGHLNGRIEKEGEPPHVVRGTSRKDERLKGTAKDIKKKTTKYTIEERIELVIRTVDQTGEIRDIVDTSSEHDQVPEELRKEQHDRAEVQRLCTA